MHQRSLCDVDCLDRNRAYSRGFALGVLLLHRGLARACRSYVDGSSNVLRQIFAIIGDRSSETFFERDTGFPA
jgi:hypothetical protein